MELLERLEFCKKCDNRKYSKTGIVCSLTDQKPIFESECLAFVMDPAEISKQKAKEKYKDYNFDNDEKSSTKSTIWIVIVVILVIWRIIRLIVKLF